MTQFITPVEAARLVGDDMTLAVSGHAGFGTAMVRKATPAM